MPIHLESFKHNLKLQLDNDPQLNGLDTFKKSLEKDYFSKVTIRNCSPDRNFGNLVIEMDCNFDLVEILFHLQKGTWGGIPILQGNKQIAPSFFNTLSRLRELNSLPIDVEELSIFFNDSSIIIKKIYAQSIEEQLGNILNSIAEHYVYLSKGLTETPNEIYVPVFEEDVLENDSILSKIRTGDNSEKDYFGFWGLYFGSEEDAVIYDLGNKSIISGDLYLLNH